MRREPEYKDLRLLTKELEEIVVAPDTYQVSPEPLLLVAELRGALALCLHDEGRGMGGLLHLRFGGDSGRPSDVTDNTLNGVLVVLDRFKRAVIGHSPRRERLQARIVAHALPPVDAGEPTATLADLLQADLQDARIECGRQMLRRSEPVRLCFEPLAGRMWVCGARQEPSGTRARRA